MYCWGWSWAESRSIECDSGGGQAARLIDSRSVSIDPWCSGLNQATGDTAAAFYLSWIDPDLMMIRSSGGAFFPLGLLAWVGGWAAARHFIEAPPPKSQARPHRPAIRAPNGRGGLESIDPCPHRPIRVSQPRACRLVVHQISCCCWARM